MAISKFKYLPILFSFVLFVSCESSNLGANFPKKSASTHSRTFLSSRPYLANGKLTLSNKVSRQLAKKVALNFANKYRLNMRNLAKGKVSMVKQNKRKSVRHITALKDSAQNNLLYLISFRGSGFVIVAGDKRSSPILAYSKSHKFRNFNSIKGAVKNHLMPAGLAMWLLEQKAAIEQLKKGKSSSNGVNGTSQKGLNPKWKTLACPLPPLPQIKRETVLPLCQAPPPGDPGDPGGGGGGCDPDPVIRHVDPLLSTNWDQGVGYNNIAPYDHCEPSPANGQDWAGCVAVAMGQVMNYYEYPDPDVIAYKSGNIYALWDWSEIGDHPGDAVSWFLRDLGDKLNNDWGCDVTSANAKDIVPALHDFGYSANRIKFGHDKWELLEDELDAGRPVLLEGYTKGTWFGLKWGDGHEWVVDGYDFEYYACVGYKNVVFHVNWGWGYYYNGWYTNPDNSGTKTNPPQDQVSPMTHYQHHMHMIINIQPQ